MAKIHVGCTICLGISLVFVLGLAVSVYFTYTRAWVGAYIHYKTGMCEIMGCNTSATSEWEGRYYIYYHSTVITLRLLPDNTTFVPSANTTYERTIYDYYDMYYYGAYLSSLCGQNTTTCYYQEKDIDGTLDAMAPDQSNEWDGQLAFAIVLIALIIALIIGAVAGFFAFAWYCDPYNSYSNPPCCCF